MKDQPANYRRPLWVEEGRWVEDLDDGGHQPVERFGELVANRGEANGDKGNKLFSWSLYF
jgi:endonuclease I